MILKNMGEKNLKELLVQHKACNLALEYVNGKDFKIAWDECIEPGWMLWLLRKQADRPGWLTLRQVVGLCGRVAATVLEIYEAKFPGDSRVRQCLQATQDFEAGKIIMEKLSSFATNATEAAHAAADGYAAVAGGYAAAAAAYAAAYAAYGAYASATAYAANAAACVVIANAHVAADNVADAADNVAHAADNAAHAAADVAYADAAAYATAKKNLCRLIRNEIEVGGQTNG